MEWLNEAFRAFRDKCKWEIKIGAYHGIVPWILECASHLLSRFQVGHDGRKAYERCKGKGAKNMGIEFDGGALEEEASKGSPGETDQHLEGRGLFGRQRQDR